MSCAPGLPLAAQSLSRHQITRQHRLARSGARHSIIPQVAGQSSKKLRLGISLSDAVSAHKCARI